LVHVKIITDAFRFERFILHIPLSLFWVVFLMFTPYTRAQTGMAVPNEGAWTLDRCIKHALDSNLSIRQAAIQVTNNRNELRQLQWSRYPTANAGSSLSLNNGRVIDPFTNTFDEQTIESNQLSLQSGALLYGGGQLRQGIKSQEMAFEASKEDLNSTKNNIALSIANLYLQALLAEKLEESAVKQLEMTRAQRERIQKLVDAGALSIDNLLNIRAQESSEELSLVNARNTTTNALINLALLLQLPDPSSFRIKQATQFELQIPLEIGIQALYAQAEQRMPELKAAQLREKQALYGLSAARAARYPSLRGFANMSTVYSSTNRRFLTDQPPVITGTAPVGYLENDPTQLVVRPVLSYPTALVPRFSQWGDNLGYGLGLSLSIPIANGAQVETQIKRATQSATQARLQIQTARNQLFTDVTRAITEYRAALARVEANRRNVEAQRENYSFSERRQEQGLINPVEFTTIKNRLQIAEVNLEQARYEMLFRAKVIDFYLGRPIILE